MQTTSNIRYASAVFSDRELEDTIITRLETYARYSGRIHYGHLSEEGTLTAFLQLQGDDGSVSEIRAAIERHPGAVTYEFDVDDDIRLYMEFEPVEWTRDLHEVFRRHGIKVDWPMEPTAEGGLRFTVLGREPIIKDALGELEAGWDLSITRFGSSQAINRPIQGDLTARQQEILRRAVADGYYDLPRRATQQDLADAFGVSTATMSEHLRKIESKVFRSIVE